MSFYNQNTKNPITKDNIIYHIKNNIITIKNILSYYISTYNHIIRNNSLDLNNDIVFNKLIIFNNNIIRIIDLYNRISASYIIGYSKSSRYGGKSSKSSKKITKPVKKKNYIKIITNK